MTNLIGFTHEHAALLEAAGGKGASLARSARALPVPPGVIVVAGAYRAYLAPLEPRIREMLRNRPDIDAAAQQIQALVLGAELPPSWLDELAVALDEHGLAGHGVAVRSSGTMKDLPGAAFAGQHDTFLGVRGVEAIAAAIRGCYASLWNGHAMRYRDRLGLDHLQASMAVVVQRMVEVTADEAAGVAFSIDPVRGDLGTVLINAAFGLGETVVAGEAEVDEYLVARESFEDRATRIAHKPQALVSLEDVGTAEVHLDDAQADRAALTAEQRARVARLAVQAEEHFGFPQDIEWAFSGGELFLLQSRPVTRVAARRAFTHRSTTASR